MAKKAKKDTKKSGRDKNVQPVEPGQGLGPIEEMERWIEGHYPRAWMRPFHMEWPSWSQLAAPFEGRMPKVDVVERDDEVVVRAEVPGVDKRDLDVSVTENSVTIRGETSHETKEEKGDYVRSELSRGTFSRVVSLPAIVDADQAKAAFKDGILELSLAKIKKSKRKSISIE